MSSGSHQVGVIEIAIWEVRAVIEEQCESVSFEVSPIPFQIILAKLIDDQNHNQFGMGVVGAGGAWDACSDWKKESEEEDPLAFEHSERIAKSD